MEAWNEPLTIQVRRVLERPAAPSPAAPRWAKAAVVRTNETKTAAEACQAIHLRESLAAEKEQDEGAGPGNERDEPEKTGHVSPSGP